MYFCHDSLVPACSRTELKRHFSHHLAVSAGSEMHPEKIRRSKNNLRICPMQHLHTVVNAQVLHFPSLFLTLSSDILVFLIMTMKKFDHQIV